MFVEMLLPTFPDGWPISLVSSNVTFASLEFEHDSVVNSRHCLAVSQGQFPAQWRAPDRAVCHRDWQSQLRTICNAMHLAASVALCE